ncbi:phage regulatory CII family protein [Ferrimonas pelagia]|uniref:Rha family transcriptional regulator n=1 Tax=Ferrimonas pelagia TaxID=1177826 RepID=A0ABP9EIM0_9GAMM
MITSNDVSQVLAAAHSFALVHGANALSDHVGSSPHITSNRFNPHNTDHHLRLADAVAVSVATGDARIVSEFARVCGYRLEPLESIAGDAQQVLQTVLALESGKGALANTLLEAMADGRISPREEQELAAAVDSLQGQIAKLALRRGQLR